MKVRRTTVVPASSATLTVSVSWKFDQVPVLGVATVTVSTAEPLVKVAVTLRFGPPVSPSDMDRLKS
ncbi:hypothetical protein D3C71_1808420 [compost metagenome]